MNPIDDSYILYSVPFVYLCVIFIGQLSANDYFTTE
jgi:hypothetical protein